MSTPEFKCQTTATRKLPIFPIRHTEIYLAARRQPENTFPGRSGEKSRPERLGRICLLPGAVIVGESHIYKDAQATAPMHGTLDSLLQFEAESWIGQRNTVIGVVTSFLKGATKGAEDTSTKYKFRLALAAELSMDTGSVY